MEADKLKLILLARIAGEVDPASYVISKLIHVEDQKAVASKVVHVFTKLVDLGHKDDDGNPYLTPVTKRETTTKVSDGTEAVTVA